MWTIMTTMHTATMALLLLSLRHLDAQPATCPVATNVVTTVCASQCLYASSFCIVYAMNTSANVNACNGANVSPLSECMPADYGCRYQCFQPYEDDTVFKFYIPFGAFKSDQETQQETSSSWLAETQSLTDESANVPWQSDDFVDRIGPLTLSKRVRRIVVAGGRTEMGVKGKVVNVALSDDTFARARSHTQLILANLALDDASIATAVSSSPSLGKLILRNVLLERVPTGEGVSRALSNLTELDLSLNYLTTIPADLHLQSLRTLILAQNNLTQFDAVFDTLEHLDLSDNALEAIPDVVFSLRALETLILRGNPLRLAAMNDAQYLFLNAIPTLRLAPFADSVSECIEGTHRPLGSTTVCVTNDLALARIRSANADARQTSSPSTSRPLSSSSTRIVIIGTVVGVVLVAVGLLVWIKRRRSAKSAKRGDVDSNTHKHDEDVASPMIKYSALGDEQHGSVGATTSTSGGNGGVGQSSSSSVSAPWKRAMSSTSSSSWGISLWDDDELLSRQVRYEDVEDVRLIGSGGHGVVWLVRYRQSRLLASKRLVRDQNTRQKTLDFVHEIKLVARLDHPSIIEFIGVAWTVETDLQALFEYMSHGDLRSYLEATAAGPDQDEELFTAVSADLTRGAATTVTTTTWPRHKWQFALDVIEALVYVHSFNPPLVHRDLKSRNVLLSDDLKAKVSDFGVSRFESDRGTMTTGVGTGKWLAPEVIAGSTSYNASCDIYAFGVLLTEIDTHSIPYDDVRGPHGNRLPEVALLQLVAMGQLRPSLSKECPSGIETLVRTCLAFEPTKRPSAVEIAFELRTIGQQSGFLGRNLI